VSRRPSAILVEKRTESSAGVVLQLRLPQHADQHGPERPILLAVDQAFREDARLRWSKRGDGRVRPDGEGDTSPAIPIRPVVSSGRLSQTRPNGSCSICGCPVQTIRTRTECHVADGGTVACRDVRPGPEPVQVIVPRLGGHLRCGHFVELVRGGHLSPEFGVVDPADCPFGSDLRHVAGLRPRITRSRTRTGPRCSRWPRSLSRSPREWPCGILQPPGRLPVPDRGR